MSFHWINVSELSFPESNATTIYNVRKLPASFLLNRKGEVVARDIYGKELQKWLDNMLDNDVANLQKGKKIYFVSDAHLGLPPRQKSLEREKRLVSMA